jgi:hypothetical protein
MRALWRRLHAWWVWKRNKTIELPGFFLPEVICIFCGDRFEIMGAEMNPQYAKPRMLHGCRSCRRRGVYNSIWVEI